jgi:NADH dehydrogenase
VTVDADTAAPLPHVVIIGAGFGGLDAARTLAHAPVRITVIDRHNYHLFQPLLYQVATASLSPGDVASPIRWILRKQPNVQVLLAEARAVDLAAQHVVIDAGGGDPAAAGMIPFDYLIIATGATHAYFGHPEWAARAPGLKTLDDALEIRRRVLLAFEAAERESDAERQRRLLTFVIVGGGPTGVELAGALGEIARHSLRQDFRSIRPESARIVLVEGSPRVLGTFAEALSGAARRSLEQLGIEVHTASVVVAVDENGVTYRDGAAVDHRIEAETILWAAGVAASPLTKSLGVPLDRAGRVAVEPGLTLPGHPNVFVVGDVAAVQQDGRPLPGVAQVAKQEGTQAARNIALMLRGQSPVAFRYRDLGSMATIGRGSAVAEIGRVKAHGWPAWLIWLFVHIFSLIGFRSRFAVLSEWAWAYVTQQRRVRLITGERLWPGSPNRK